MINVQKFIVSQNMYVEFSIAKLGLYSKYFTAMTARSEEWIYATKSGA